MAISLSVVGTATELLTNADVLVQKRSDGGFVTIVVEGVLIKAREREN